MEQQSSVDDELYFRHHPFTKQFTEAVHCLLISCSRQEVLSYFSHFNQRQQDFLYKVFTLTVTQIYENCVAEFRSICKKTQVLEALDHVNSEEFLLPVDIRDSISPRDVVREVAVKRKREELALLKQTLQKTEEENSSLATHLEGLREKVNEAKDLISVDAVIEKIRNISLKLEKVISGDTISSRNLRKRLDLWACWLFSLPTCFPLFSLLYWASHLWDPVSRCSTSESCVHYLPSGQGDWFYGFSLIKFLSNAYLLYKRIRYPLLQTSALSHATHGKLFPYKYSWEGFTADKCAF